MPSQITPSRYHTTHLYPNTQHAIAQHAVTLSQQDAMVSHNKPHVTLTHNKLLCYHTAIVGNPRVILIVSLFHQPWVHLVTFACFQSNMHNLCDLFLPNEITCYVCVLLFSFGGALFKPTWQNQHVLL